MFDGSAARWLKYRLGVRPGDTQVTPAEHECLLRHAAGKRSLVEIGVMHGVTTALLRSVMDEEGMITAIDPLPVGRLGVNFNLWIARREISKYPRGRAVLLRQFSHDAAATWTSPIDFLFVDGDHTWLGIDRDWRDWSGYIADGGVVALHDSRSVPCRPDHDSVGYTQTVILTDARFRQIDAADTLTVLKRIPASLHHD